MSIAGGFTGDARFGAYRGSGRRRVESAGGTRGKSCARQTTRERFDFRSPPASIGSRVGPKTWIRAPRRLRPRSLWPPGGTGHPPDCPVHLPRESYVRYRGMMLPRPEPSPAIGRLLTIWKVKGWISNHEMIQFPYEYSRSSLYFLISSFHAVCTGCHFTWSRAGRCRFAFRRRGKTRRVVLGA